MHAPSWQLQLLWHACHPATPMILPLQYPAHPGPRILLLHQAPVACCREAIRETEFFYEGDNPRSAGQRKFDVLLTSYEIVLKDKAHFLSCRQAFRLSLGMLRVSWSVAGRLQCDLCMAFGTSRALQACQCLEGQAPAVTLSCWVAGGSALTGPSPVLSRQATNGPSLSTSLMVI